MTIQREKISCASCGVSWTEATSTGSVWTPISGTPCKHFNTDGAVFEREEIEPKIGAVHVSTKSKQDYITPMSFVELCAREAGVTFVIDLAADETNKRARAWYSEEDTALDKDWKKEVWVQEGMQDVLPGRAAAWLNPPFNDTPAFMRKCAEQGAIGCKIVTLTLSSLGTKWYREHVQPSALSLILQDRITFEGQPAAYPKELMVSFFGFGKTGLGWWKWAR